MGWTWSSSPLRACHDFVPLLLPYHTFFKYCSGMQILIAVLVPVTEAQGPVASRWLPLLHHLYCYASGAVQRSWQRTLPA